MYISRMIRGILAIFMLFVVLTQPSCLFKKTELTGVMSYREGKVYIKKHRFYRVGALPEGWRGMETRARAISFYNPQFRSSITTDAFCGPKVENSAMSALGGDMISALEKRTVSSEEEITLDGRKAMRRFFTGYLDGAEIAIDYVVLRKDGCLFDFYAVMPGGKKSKEVSEAFEGFFQGFEFK